MSPARLSDRFGRYAPRLNDSYRPEAVIHDPAFYLSNSSICARRFLRACSVAEGLLPSVAPFFMQLAMLSGASGPRMLGILTQQYAGVRTFGKKPRSLARYH